MESEDGSPAWASEYKDLQPTYRALASEVEFALDATTAQAEIKTHSVSSRVKTLESLDEKCREKGIEDPLTDVNDLVGIRVVVLFLSDLPRIDQLIRRTFDVHEADDKVAGGDPASFGYMSVHYIATLKTEHSGPRYDNLKGIRFEIQVRTIVMDAWANVSHYLDYKGKSSVPEELRKDFFALSGLFYVADQHFETFADQARTSRERASDALKVDPNVEINLDTMEAFLARRYPDRTHSDRPGVSSLVEQVTDVGYQDLGALENALDEVEARFLAQEATFPPAPPDEQSDPKAAAHRFMDVGVVRLSLRMLGKLPPLENYGPDDL